LAPVASSSTTVTTTAIGTKDRVLRSSIEEDNYFSQLGKNIDIPLKGISVTYNGSVYDENSSINFITYDKLTKQFQLGGTSSLPICTSVTVSSLLTKIILKSNYIYNKEVFEFVKLFTITELKRMAPSLEVDKSSPHAHIAYETSVAYTNLPQYVTCEGRVIDTTQKQTITSSTQIRGSISMSTGSYVPGFYYYSCSCDGKNKITFTYKFDGSFTENFKGTINFVHTSSVTF
jgi:hypothetical protein